MLSLTGRVGICLAVALLAALPAAGCGPEKGALPPPDIGVDPAIVGAPLYPGSTLGYKQGFGADEPVWIDGRYYSMVVLRSRDALEKIAGWYKDRLSGTPGYRETRSSGATAATIATSDPAVFIDIMTEDGHASIAITKEVPGPGEPPE